MLPVPKGHVPHIFGIRMKRRLQCSQMIFTIQIPSALAQGKVNVKHGINQTSDFVI